MTDKDREQIKQILADGIEAPTFNGTRNWIRGIVYQAWLSAKGDHDTQETLQGILSNVDNLTLDVVKGAKAIG